jgi:hypothetical protein
MDVRILARELYGREGRDLDVAVRTVDRMTDAGNVAGPPGGRTGRSTGWPMKIRLWGHR